MVSEAVVRVSRIVRPAAAAAVAESFTFPLALMLAVVLFLLGQKRLDHLDPKLRSAPRAEVVIPFELEDQL